MSTNISSIDTCANTWIMTQNTCTGVASSLPVLQELHSFLVLPAEIIQIIVIFRNISTLQIILYDFPVNTMTQNNRCIIKILTHKDGL